MARALVAALMTAAAGCADLPASPTYAEDVRPILLAGCVRCHRSPAPCTERDREGYALDRWDDLGDVRGVAAMTERILVRAVELGDMPPAAPLGEHEQEILRRWQRAGSPRGEALADEPAELALTGAVPATEPDDQRIRLGYDVRDPDGHAVTWSMGWRREGVDGALTPALAEGQGEVELDVGVLASGSYQLVARVRGELEDRTREVALGAPIALGPRPAAPSVALLAPRGVDSRAAGSSLPVRWQADDVDSTGPLTASVRLVDGAGSRHELAGDLDARAGEAQVTLDVPAGDYAVEVEVADEGRARTARSPCSLTVRP